MDEKLPKVLAGELALGDLFLHRRNHFSSGRIADDNSIRKHGPCYFYAPFPDWIATQPRRSMPKGSFNISQSSQHFLCQIPYLRWAWLHCNQLQGIEIWIKYGEIIQRAAQARSETRYATLLGRSTRKNTDLLLQVLNQLCKASNSTQPRAFFVFLVQVFLFLVLLYFRRCADILDSS
jgi:hypothetical protein